MNAPPSFRDARPEDQDRILFLLRAAGLPTADVSLSRQEFIVATVGEEVIACAGLERFGEAGLFRSFAVEPARRNLGLGAALCQRILARAALRGLRDAWLLTTTAEPFFRRMGFERVERARAPAALAASPEFQALCPASAVCMHRVVA